MNKNEFSLRRVLMPLLLLFLLAGCQLEFGEADSKDWDELAAEVEAGAYGEIQSLLVWADGEMVHESYYGGGSEEGLHEVFSVTKSVVSMMIGQAIEAGEIESVDTYVIDYFPEAAGTSKAIDTRRESMTLAHLLTMQAGYEWDELTNIYGSPANSVTGLTRSTDWLNYVLTRELAADPGTQFTYNSGVSMLLAGILEEQTGMSAEAYAEANLFGPVGIDSWVWEKTPGGHSNGGWGLHLTPRDMLKLGRLFLQGGEWEGVHVVPSAWVTRSSAALVDAGRYDYGYQWWRFADSHAAVADLKENDLYLAWGFGGQFIIVAPHLDLVVVTTAENYADSEQFFAVLPDIFALVE